MNRISLCMIVRNEEKTIAACLKSAREVVDEMIIVDTGSTDGTVELCRSFGAVIHYFDWCDDFAKARNFGLERATGDWILMMDADDELIISDCQNIRSLTDNEQIDAYFFLTENWVGNSKDPSILNYAQLRLFRNRPEFRFQGAIHELIPAIARACYKYVPIKIIHRGYLDTLVQERQKVTRNVAILQKELADRPNDPAILYYLANEMLRTDRLEEAIDFYEQAQKHSCSSDGKPCYWLPELPTKYAFCLWKRGQAEKALQVLKEAQALHPKHTDLWFLLGNILFENGDLESAGSAFATCLTLGEAPPEYPSQAGCGSFQAAFLLGIIALEQRNIELAQQHFHSALQMNPQHLPSLSQLCTCLWIQHEFRQVQDMLNRLPIPVKDMAWIRFLARLNQVIKSGRMDLEMYTQANVTSFLNCLAALAGFQQTGTVAKLLYQLPQRVLDVAMQESWFYEALGGFWLSAAMCLERLE